MQTITIEVNTLLPIVKENKQKHDVIYNAAVLGYWEKAEEILNEKLVKVKNKEKIEPYLGLSYPINYDNDYNRVIRMLELTPVKEVQLNQNEFDSYVRNEWSWKNSFFGTNSIYCSGAFITGAMSTFSS